MIDRTYLRPNEEESQNQKFWHHLAFWALPWLSLRWNSTYFVVEGHICSTTPRTQEAHSMKEHPIRKDPINHKIPKMPDRSWHHARYSNTNQVKLRKEWNCIILKWQCMANVNNSNVYVYKPRNKLVRTSQFRVINPSKAWSTTRKVSIDRASMSWRKH